MKFLKAKVLALAISVFIHFELKSQNPSIGQVSIASPTAAALGKYADIPVNYHTGIPQIDIPIYTVESGSLKLPIGLSYHASGLKVVETASWVGAGWSLNAGGVITRTVMGLPDEKNTGYGANDIYGYFSDYGYNKYFYANGDQDWTGFAQGRKDGEPDLFFFNVGGYSGKFFFRDDRTPILVPEQDIKIVPFYPPSQTQSIQGFTLTTPEGTIYSFGNTPGYAGNATEITNSFSGSQGLSTSVIVSSWFLNGIQSHDSQYKISLSYVPESYGYYTYASSPVDSYASPTADNWRFSDLSVVKNLLSGVRLSKIDFPNGHIDFIAGELRTDLSDNTPNNSDYLNTQARTLKSIIISNNNIDPNFFSKKFDFNYSYFQDNVSPQPSSLTTMGFNLKNDKSRLRLDSVQEISTNNLIHIPPHKFSYFTELVPRRINLGVDHWGFYNAASNNTTLIPNYTTTDGATTTLVPGANRNSAWPSMRGGALQSITYPTGGTTTFDFEPCDSYLKSTSSLQSVIMPGGSEVHMHYQGNTSINSSITSNGQPITITVFNNSNLLATLIIKDSHGTPVYTNNTIDNHSYTPGGNGGQPVVIGTPLYLSAGTYSTTLSFSVIPPDNEGASVSFSQLTTVTNSYPIVIGGLRIKSITSSTTPADPVPVVKNYTYPQGGYLYSFPTYIQHMRNDIVQALGFWGPTTGFYQTPLTASGCPIGGSGYKKSGGSLQPMMTTQGNHIGYPQVIVSQPGNGSTEYNYYTSNTGYAPQSVDPTIQTINISTAACESNSPNYPAAPKPFDSRLGELYLERHFTESVDLLKNVYYYPEYIVDSQYSTPGFIVTTLSTGAYLGTAYNLTIPRKTRMHIIEMDFGPGLGAPRTQTDTYIYYGSNYHNQETRKVVTTSTGDSIITNTKYSADFHNPSWDVSPSCETSYTTACNTCLVNFNNAGGGTAAYLLYRQCLSNARNTYVDLRRTNYTDETNTYKTRHDAAKASATAELKPVLDLQDQNRVVPIETTTYRDNNLLNANFTRYDYAAYPAGIPYPQKTQIINLAQPSSTFSSSGIASNTLVKDSRYQDETTYRFLNGNPATVTGHDGLNTSYIWDYNNTSPIAKTTSATLDSTAFTSFEANGTGNWIFAAGTESTSQVNITVNAPNTTSIFTSQTPTAPTDNDNRPTVGQEVGVKFKSSVAGSIIGIRFYKTSGNSGTHIGELYSSTGTRLAQATFTGETATGWQTVTFSTPVTITANTTYTAAYFSSLGYYTEDNDFFKLTGVTNSPLTAVIDGTNGASGTDPGTGQGVFAYSATAVFPNQLYRSANYWVDVLFSSGAAPAANAGSNQTITLPTNTVSLNGSASMGTITSYAWTKISGPNTPTISTPTAVTSNVTGLIAGTYVFQLSVNAGASTSQITVVVQPSGSTMNIFTTQVPVAPTDNDHLATVGQEVGLKFTTTIAGYVTGVRFYKTSGNIGTHIGELYSATGTRLAQVTFTGETATGWQTASFSSPVFINANTTYTVAYFSSLGYYVEDNDYFLKHTLVNAPITAPSDGTDGGSGTDPGTGQGTYKYTSTAAFPDQLYRSANYWVDIVFLPGSAPTANAGPAKSVTLPTSTVTLDGSGSTGTVTSYLWTQVSGPNNPIITTPNSPTTNISGLIQGNYVFQLSANGGMASAYALTGIKSYNLAGNTISKSGLTVGKKYIVSYWSRGSACNIGGATSTSAVGRSVNGWTYYEHIVTMTSTLLSITGSNYIDELRLYPQGAQMSSYTYKPLVGLTTMNDPNSEVTYYDFDEVARLKNIRDYQGNIVKNYQYNYVDLNGCGTCQVISMQTFAGTPTLSYPVGVFNVNGKLLGNATNQSQYITSWMADTANSHTGTITAGADSMHFKFAVNVGRTIPDALTGCRYYQFDFNGTIFDAIRNYNATYVDFGDGTSMKLGTNNSDSNVIRAANTYINAYSYVPSPPLIYWNHTYPDTSLKTLTFYHNDGVEALVLDNGSQYSFSFIHISNYRGNLPQHITYFGGTSLQKASATTVSGFKNWNSINSITTFQLRNGDDISPCLNISYAQDFMAGNVNLSTISTNDRGYWQEGSEDTTFKISRLKSDWNIYFTSLTTLMISDGDWNREDLTALIHLSKIFIVAGNVSHSYDHNSGLIQIPTIAIDNIINQVAAGSGQYTMGGYMSIGSGGIPRSSASDTSLTFLKSRGWSVLVNGQVQ